MKTFNIILFSFFLLEYLLLFRVRIWAAQCGRTYMGNQFLDIIFLMVIIFSAYSSFFKIERFRKLTLIILIIFFLFFLFYAMIPIVTISQVVT